MEEFAYPLTLRFHDPALERAYRAYRLRAFFRELDTHYLAAQTALAAGFFLLQPFVFPSIAFQWPNVVYPAICLANCLVIRALPWHVYSRHRHSIQLLFRVLVDWSVVYGLPTWSPPVAVRSLGSFATHLVLTSGAGCLNWASVGWPLLLQHHLPYNLLAATAFSHMLAPHVCTVVRQNDHGRHLMAALWRVAASVAGTSGRLRALLLVSPGLLPAPSSTSSSSPPSLPSTAATSHESASIPTDPAGAFSSQLPTSRSSSYSESIYGSGSGSGSFLGYLSEADACWATVSLVQLLLGFVLPTALVVVLERSSREHFLRKGYQLRQDDSASGGDGDSGAASSGNGDEGGGCKSNGEAEEEGEAGAGPQQETLRRRHPRRPDALEDSLPRFGSPPPPSAQQPQSEQPVQLGRPPSPRPPHPPSLQQQQEPHPLLPRTVEQLRRYRRRDHFGGGWDPCELVRLGVLLLLAVMVVGLIWELQVDTRFLLGPMLMRLTMRQGCGGGGCGDGGGGDSGAPST